MTDTMKPFVLLLTAFLVACGGEDGYSCDNTETLVEKVNEIRVTGASCGSEFFPPVRPLVVDYDLASLAREHAGYLAATNQVTHFGEGNATVSQRALARGILYPVGENVAGGVSDPFQAFLNSSEHCKNMMHSKYSLTVAACESRNYIVQSFGVKP